MQALCGCFKYCQIILSCMEKTIELNKNTTKTLVQPQLSTHQLVYTGRDGCPYWGVDMGRERRERGGEREREREG